MKPFLIPSQTMASIGKLSWRWAEHLSLMHHNLPLICINIKDELEEMSSWYPSQQEQHVHVQHIADTEPKLYWKSPHELKCYGCGSTQERCGRGSYLFCIPAERNSFHLWMQVSTPLCGLEASIWQWWCRNMAVVVRFWKAILKYSVIDRCQISRASSSLLGFEKRCDQCQILRNDAVICQI